MRSGHRPGAAPRQPGDGLQGLVGPAWMDRAACRRRNREGRLFYNPEIFFPTHGPYTPAKTICRSCPVTAQCLDFAMANEAGHTAWARYGVYGGLTPDERAALAKETA